MRPIKTGHGLWSQLVKRAALDLRRYDKDVATDFRKNLNLPENGSIVERLRERKTRPEPVLGGFFGSIQPFTHMFRDILSLVEWAGMSEGKENLLIEFDFDEGKKFKLDLDNFREQVERFSLVTRPLIIDKWDSRRLWDLWEVFGDNVYESTDESVRKWSEEYFSGHWPELDLDPPSFDDQDLNELVNRSWQVRRATIEAARNFSTDPRDLRQVRGSTSEELVLENERLVASEGGMQTIAYLHSDHWADSIAKKAYARAMEARSDASVSDSLKQRLSYVLDNPPPERRDVEEALRELEELLKLPIWQRRYELYSIWVLTQIVNALGGPSRFKFELEGDAFHIPFSPKLLVTTKDLEPPIRIWSEVRYKLHSPRGKGRTSGMQPDYTLTLDTRNPPEEAFALVECKQYLRSSGRNFRTALIDYASGQPGASVALVNYGPVGPSVIKGIPARLLPSVKAIGHLRPLQQESSQEFSEWLLTQVERNTISKTGPEAVDPTAPPSHTSTAFLEDNFARIELHWGTSPRDLDLCLFLPTATGGWKTINFINTGTLEEWPWVQLRGDVISGSGPEIIDVRKAMPGLYRIAVKLYSNDAPLAGSNASLTLHIQGKEAKTFICPVVGEGTWWSVCNVDFLSRLITEVNLIGDTSPATDLD
jgi:hypothetical protein